MWFKMSIKREEIVKKLLMLLKFLNFPNTWKIVMQIMAGSCGNFAKYKCKQITSWDKSGYKLWHQFMENLKTKPKV